MTSIPGYSARGPRLLLELPEAARGGASSGLLARLGDRHGADLAGVALLPPPGRHVPVVVGVAGPGQIKPDRTNSSHAQSGRAASGPAGADTRPSGMREALAAIRAGGLFWPLPRAGAVSPERLLVDSGRGGEAAALLDQLERIDDPSRAALLAPRPAWFGAVAQAARRRGLAVVDEAADLDPAGLVAVAGHPLDPAMLWAVLAGLATVETPARPAPWRVQPEDLLRLAHCRDPWDGGPVGLARAVEILAFLRERLSANRQPTMTFGMSAWKFSVVRPFLAGPDGVGLSRNHSTLRAAVADARRNGGRVAAWGNRALDIAEATCAEAGVPLLRIEDGFLRSVGLGLQRSPPASLVVDQGISYFDASHATVLETILQTSVFTPDLLRRAALLRERIIEARLTKYNVGGHEALPAVTGRTRLLVPGQVEGDQSLAFGSPRIRTNLDLLAVARERNPDAYILFKPHPDVLTGLRAGDVPAHEVERLADATVRSADMAECLDWADAVETMTSLTGFEALLRGKRVTTHGLPFYAGWGLTTDMIGLDRRTRRLTLDELVAGTLILNPRYVDPVTGLPAEPELVARRLDEAAHRSPTLAGRALFAYRAGMSLFAHKVYARLERRYDSLGRRWKRR